MSVEYDEQFAGQPLLWMSMRRDQLVRLRDRGACVMVPVGAIEQHGPHLPVNTDISDAYSIAQALSCTCDDPRIVVAPPVWWGVSHYHGVFPGALSLHVRTLMHLLMDLCESISRNGFRQIVILNGHGGNEGLVETVAMELSARDLPVTPITYWNLIPEIMTAVSEADSGHIGHAGEMETSLQLFLQPDLVDRAAVHEGLGCPMQDVPLIPGVYQVPRVLEEAPSGVYGMAHMGTASKGEQIVRATVARLEKIVQGLQQSRRIGEGLTHVSPRDTTTSAIGHPGEGVRP